MLLALFGEPERWWSAPEAAAKLRPAAPITDADAIRYLDLFHARGLIAVNAEKRVRFVPQSQFFLAQVHILAQAYRERPVTLIRVIYALRDSKVHSFAEAFKLRRG